MHIGIDRRRGSRPARALALVGTILALAAAATTSAGEDPPAPDPQSPEFCAYVMDKIDDQYRGEKSHGIMKMRVKTAKWERSLELEAWTLGEDHSLVRILSPKKEKGSATLKAGKDLFTYLSATGKTIKIGEGLMGGSWMGSHFTNDDLVQHSRLSEDYKIVKTFSGEASGTMVHRFELTPKPDAPVVWGKIEISVRQGDLQPLRQLFYDEDGGKVRVLKFYDHKKIQGRTIPGRMVMTPLDVEGEFTEVAWSEIDFGVELTKDFFSLAKLKSMK